MGQLSGKLAALHAQQSAELRHAGPCCAVLCRAVLCCALMLSCSPSSRPPLLRPASRLFPLCTALQAYAIRMSNNSLSGLLFPAGWLQEGAFSALRRLYLDGNAGLTGTLPASLAWPYLETL